MKIVKWILDLFKPSYKVRCIDCGKIIDVNKESHYWWNEPSPGRTDDERTFVQCVDCAIDEDN
jgi:hypothetical protein